MKHCPRCERDLPDSEFGICRARKDGINLYCRICCRQKVNAGREKRRAYLAVRKPCVPAFRRVKATPRDKVKLAYARGVTDRAAIRKMTGLHWDVLVDIIADLNDMGVIRWNRYTRRFELAA